MASKFFALIGQDTVWAIGTDRDSTIAEARKWATFDDAEWAALAEDGRTGDLRDEGTFQIVECSDALAEKVRQHGGQVGFRFMDDVAVTQDEYDAYRVFFEDRDELGNEHNGGEPITVDGIEQAGRECAERNSRGTLWQGERKVGEINESGDWRWV